MISCLGAEQAGHSTLEVTPRERICKTCEMAITAHSEVYASYELSQGDSIRSNRFRKKSLSFLKPMPWSRNRDKTEVNETGTLYIFKLI